MEQVHTEAMSRYKKAARNSPHRSTTDKLCPAKVAVICAGMTGWMGEVGNQWMSLAFHVAFDIVSHMGQTGVVLLERMDHSLA